MSPLTRRCFVALGITLCFAPAALADWPALSPQNLADQSDLIVMGTMGTPVRASHPDQRGNHPKTAILRISRAFGHTAPPTDTVVLDLTPDRANGAVASTDFDPPENLEGLWFLQSRPLGHFRVFHPDGFISAPQVDAVLKDLDLPG